MPPVTTIPILGHLKFFSHSLKLPTQAEWRQPQGDPPGPHYADSLSPDERVAVPSTIPPMFMPQNLPNKYHQDSCDKIGKEYKQFIDDMCDAVKFGHNFWKLQCKFQNLQVNALIAFGSPGCLSGPELEGLIKKFPKCVAMTGNKAKLRDAVAKGVSTCFKNWQDQVTVPGLPWYPAFVAFPGPMAPPMPNVPMPMITCLSAKMSDIILPNTMATEMENALDQSIKDEDKDKVYKAVFDGIATVCALGFLMWLPQQMVMLVMAKGQIPSFAPPYAPVGPVVMGDNLGVPGHTIS